MSTLAIALLVFTADAVVIPAGETLEIVSGDYNRVIVEGTWKASRTQDTRIAVDTILVTKGGTLDLGTVDDPLLVDCDIAFKDTAPTLSIMHLGEQADVGIVSMGNVFMHGVPKKHYTTASEDLSEGQVLLTLANTTGWEAGDRVWIPTLKQQGHFKAEGTYRWTDLPRAAREYEIESIQGNRVTLRSGLVEDVPAIAEVTNPIVVNLSRSITLRSANPAGHRGHMAFVHGAGCDIRFVEVRDFGRTIAKLKKDRRGRALKGSDGNLVHEPSVIGRYPMHFHHMHDHDTSRHWEGVVVDGGGVSKWGLVVHQTDNAIVKDCVAYNLNGSGFVLEDQNESSYFVGNIAGNITAEDPGLSRGMSPLQGPASLDFPLRGMDGSGFWINGLSVYEDNLAVNCHHGYQFPGMEIERLAKLLWPEGGGKQVGTPGGLVDIPLARLDDSKAIACFEGVEVWRAKENGQASLHNCIIAHCGVGMDVTRESWALYDTQIVGNFDYGPPRRLSRTSVGVESDSAYTADATMERSIISGMHIGLLTARNWRFNQAAITDCHTGMYLGNRGNPDMIGPPNTRSTFNRFHGFPKITGSVRGNYYVTPNGSYTDTYYEEVPWMLWDSDQGTWAFESKDIDQ